ncbi:MAG: murein biosynthesis integral membrane protein MurJ [Candidatus Omnitrophica bacterium]|nr:murein biosynthesis integral membrane protein MurJ [Candidatus Omnitrophota bacterium]
MSENKSLIKSTRVIGAATLASRILGFIRDVIIAKFFGTGFRAQAFVVAFRIPNLLRSLVGEGTTNSAVVPVLSRLKAQGEEEEFWQVAGGLLNILIVLLASITLLGELFAPYIVRAIAPGFITDPAKLNLTIRLTRWLFPYILLIGLAAYATAVLNSLKHFALPALAPCMLNISLIISALVFCPRLREPVDGLVVGVLAGGLLQLMVQAPLLIKKGLVKKRFPAFFHPKIKEIGRLFLPRTLGVAVYQINLFVDTIFASLVLIVGEGALAALYYANRIVQLPLALFGIALAQAALPTFSGLAAEEDFAQLKTVVSFSLRSVFTMMVPATVGIMVLAHPLVKIIFERGSFSVYSTGITSFVLIFYCLGLTGYAGIKILANCFYSLKDTFTPGKIAGLALLLNIILNLILMWPLKMAGLALATAISVTANFVILLLVLRKRMGGGFDGFLPSLGRVALAASIMGAVLWFGFYRCQFLTGTRALLAAKLGISILLGMAVYLGALKVFAKNEAEVFLGWILRKK